MRWVIFAAALTGVFAFAQDTLKVNVETVQVYANVTDLKGRFVTGLKSDNFKVLEDGKEQKVDGFTSDDSPVSAGILIDVNGLMGDNFPVAKQGALEFLKTGNLRNEYFVVEYNDKPEVAVDYTRDLSQLEQHMAPTLRRSKTTAVLDAVRFGVEKLRSAHNPRKALLIFASSGVMKNENKASQVRDLARKLDVQLLGITITPSAPVDVPVGYSPTAIQSEVEMDRESSLDVMNDIGGDGFAADSAPDFLTLCRRIAVGMRNQYILGYQPINSVHDGKYRRLQVKLEVKDVPDLIVHTRAGYYALGPEGVIQ